MKLCAPARAVLARVLVLATMVSNAILAAETRPPNAGNAATVDWPWLRQVAAQVLDSAKVPAGGRIPDGATNTTGHSLRVPGGTLSYYPAFWVRDAAMMLGGDFVPADEIEGWVRVIAAVQPGPRGLRFGRLIVPPYSIPDHITLNGEACWYPGAYTEQGTGRFGFLPPADDAFFFIQMVHDHWRVTRKTTLFDSEVVTSWGRPTVDTVCSKAFDSVAVNAESGLVQCEAEEGRTRVDWGFCDTIPKTGSCLMPSLLRWKAARDLQELFQANGKTNESAFYRSQADRIRPAILATFLEKVPESGGGSDVLLVSATGLGRKEDVWSSAYAVWLGLLPPDVEQKIAHRLLTLYEAGGTVVSGQVRHLPPNGTFGGYWEAALCERDTYQNGGYWATPTGWLVVALGKVSPAASDRLLREYQAHVRPNRQAGAPWEWINPARNLRANPHYGSSVGLVVNAILNPPGRASTDLP